MTPYKTYIINWQTIFYFPIHRNIVQQQKKTDKFHRQRKAQDVSIIGT